MNDKAKDTVCIDLRRDTPFSLAWLVADENSIESRLAWLIGCWFKKDSNYYTLLFNGLGQELQVPVQN